MKDSDKILGLINSYKEQGKAEEAKRIAKEMLKEGLPDVLIAKFTQLDFKEILLEFPISYVEQGKAEEAKRIAKEMLKEGIPNELIEKVTQLDLKENKKLN